MLGRLGVLALLVAATGCSDRTGGGAGDGGAGCSVDGGCYEMWLTCDERFIRYEPYGYCPDGELCPRMPLGEGWCDGAPPCNSSSRCGDYYWSLPEGLSPDAGYPPGCVVGMPFKSFGGNPYGGQGLYWCASVLDAGTPPYTWHTSF